MNSAKIRFRPMKFRGFGVVPKVHTAVTLYAGSSEYLCKRRKLYISLNYPQSDTVYDAAVTGYTYRHFFIKPESTESFSVMTLSAGASSCCSPSGGPDEPVRSRRLLFLSPPRLRYFSLITDMYTPTDTLQMRKKEL